MNAFRWIDLFGLVQIELLKMNILGSLLQSKVLKMNVLGSLLQSKVLKMNALGSLLQSSSQNERFGQSFTEQSSQSEWFWLAWIMQSSSDRCFQKYRFRLAWLTHFLRNEYVSQNGCLNWLSRLYFLWKEITSASHIPWQVMVSICTCVRMSAERKQLCIATRTATIGCLD